MNKLVTSKSREDLGQSFVHFSEVKKFFRSKIVFKKLFSFDQVVFLSPTKYVHNKFLTFLSLWLLSKNSLYVQYIDSLRVVKFSILDILRASALYVIDFIFAPFILLRVYLNLYLFKLTKENYHLVTSDSSFLYLRSDLWFGVKTGGSIGHIAGVINSLNNKGYSPIFYSTENIPTVEVNYRKIEPSNLFWNLDDLPLFQSTFSFYKQIINDSILSSAHKYPKFIYQRYSKNNFTGVLLSKKLNLPLVLEYNGSEYWMSKNWSSHLKYPKLCKRIEDFNLHHANLIVVVSKTMAEDLRSLGISENKILINPNGVDPNKFNPKIDSVKIIQKFKLTEKFVFGFIGTFGPWHGAKLLTESFIKLINNNPDYKNRCRLLMIGDGVEKDACKNMIDRAGLSSCAIFTGLIPQSEAPVYLNSCDVFVSPHVPNKDGTEFFGSPTKLFEYMAMQKIIIASELNQIGEILEHKLDAIFIKPGSVNDLSRAMEYSFLNKNNLLHLSLNAYKKALSHYTWDHHTEKIIRKLNELIK